MQLGGSTIALLPAVAVGVAVVLAALVLWGVYRVRRTSGATPQPARTDERHEPEPEARDWTGEAAGGAADPPPPARRPTVADAVAARGADTEPLAAVTVATPPTAWGAAPAPDSPEPASGERTLPRPGPPPAADTSSDRPARVGQHRLTEEPVGSHEDDPPPEGRLPDGRSPDGPRPRWRWAGGPTARGEAGLPTRPAEVGSSGDATGRDASVPTAPAWSAFGSGESSTGAGSPGAPSAQDVVAWGGGLAAAAGAGGLAATRGATDGSDSSGPPGTASASNDPNTHSVSSDTAPEHPDDDTHAVVPDLDEDTDGPEPVGTGPVPPPWSPARAASAPGSPDGAGSSEAAGSPEPVSFAVQQALAARAVQRARGRPDVPDLAADDVPQPFPDARDRLLSVLLADPVTALGATTELDDTRARIDQLGDVLRRRRADLATAVHRLHASGLTGDQIGRLAGLDHDDVREILEQPSGEGSGGR